MYFYRDPDVKPDNFFFTPEGPAADRHEAVTEIVFRPSGRGMALPVRRAWANRRHVMPRNYKAVLFDLDGTLLDTLTDLADATNHALRSLGFPEHPRESFRYFIGDGVETLVRARIARETAAMPRRWPSVPA